MITLAVGGQTANNITFAMYNIRLNVLCANGQSINLIENWMSGHGRRIQDGTD